MDLLDVEIVTAGGYIGTIIAIISLIASAAALLSIKKPKIANLDDALQSTATQGAFIPLVIGRGRVGPVFAFVEDWGGGALFTQQRSLLPGMSSIGTALGFAKGGGSGPSQPSYQEAALHILCVGPASELIAIYQNGELIWKGPINPQSAPSGSTFAALNGEGFFEVHWGFPDDPILTRLQNSPKHGLAVRYAFAMKIMWVPKNLGVTRQWPRLEYEVRCPCYSQIATTPSEIPLEGDDAHPTFEEWEPAPPAYVPSGRLPADRVVFEIMAFNAATRTCSLEDRVLPGTQASLTSLYPPGGIVKVWTENNSVGLASDNMSSVLPVNQEWKYFWIISSVYVATGFGHTDIVLGPEVPASDIKRLNSTNPPYVPGGLVTEIGWASPVSTENSDGINYIHMVDQILFSKYPYGAGRRRTKFDPRSIEAAAEIAQKEKIRGALVVRDGEGVESVLASIMQDAGLFIPWDAQVGKYVFRLLRYEVSNSDIPPEAILKQPSMEAIQGQRPADVIAFTFKDRFRNYREAPLKVTDSGQVIEYETQKARKVPIEITCDRDSVARLAPRRQQEVMANLATLSFETNHATQLASPGERFTATATEGEGIQFLITEVERDLNSGKVVLDCVPDTYNPPTPSEGSVSLLSYQQPPISEATPVEPLVRFLALEMPRGLSSDRVQVLFGASRSGNKTLSVLAWGSRTEDQFSVLGQGVIFAGGVLHEDLPASSPTLLTGAIEVEVDNLSDFLASSDLTLDEVSWRAGRQILVIGDEVCFLQSVGTTSDIEVFTVNGLIRGRAGTRQVTHAAGTPFFIMQAPAVVPLESSLFLPGATLYYKAQAQERAKTVDVGAVDHQSLPIVGKAFKPLPISGLRQPTMRPSYDTAADVRLDWCYHSDEFRRTGLGTQGFGQISGRSRPKGFFRVEIVGVEDFISEDPFIVFSVSARTSFGLDALPSWVVRITHVEGSFTSDPVSITLSPA